MQFCRPRHRRLVLTAFFFLVIPGFVISGFGQTAPLEKPLAPNPKHFDHVLIVVLENQSYESAVTDDVLKSIAQKGVSFTNFGNLYHHSYPNYLAMIAGSDFNKHQRLNSDGQVDFPDDNDHRTIADLLNWKNYAEDYPSQPTDQKPFLDDRRGKYARKHVPFMSFRAVQSKTFHNVVGVNTHDTNNAFVSDIRNFIANSQKHPLPEYIFYSPNMDDDGHDPIFHPKVGLKNSSNWLKDFLTSWLNFDPATWLPKDEALKHTLVIITYDESEGNKKPERIYTVFLGDMVKPQEVSTAVNHYSVLRTIEDNFGAQPLHKDSGDGAAQVITGIWK